MGTVINHSSLNHRVKVRLVTPRRLAKWSADSPERIQSIKILKCRISLVCARVLIDETLHLGHNQRWVSVSSYLCVGLFLQVFVEAVGVGHSHLVDGLFPAGNPGSFDESASGSGGSFAFLGPPSSSFIFNIADHQPQRLQR